MGIPQREQKKMEKALEEIIENFPKLTSDIKSQMQEAYRT